MTKSDWKPFVLSESKQARSGALMRFEARPGKEQAPRSGQQGDGGEGEGSSTFAQGTVSTGHSGWPGQWTAIRRVLKGEGRERSRGWGRACGRELRTDREESEQILFNNNPALLFLNIFIFF